MGVRRETLLAIKFLFYFMSLYDLIGTNLQHALLYPYMQTKSPKDGVMKRYGD